MRAGLTAILIAVPVLVAVALAAATPACAEERGEEQEPLAIIGLGGTAEWAIPGTSRFGPTVTAETTVIKDWLEIEAGVSPLFKSGSTEWETDLIFKKPFTLSDKVEFMIGAGPAWSFSRDGTKVAGEVATEVMVWPTKDRSYGWFVEPTYSYSFASGHEQALGVSVGLLIPIR